MKRDGRWHRVGVRYFRNDGAKYNAVIFGSPVPSYNWAWAVWSHCAKAEGVEITIAGARKKANLAIVAAGTTQREAAPEVRTEGKGP